MRTRGRRRKRPNPLLVGLRRASRLLAQLRARLTRDPDLDVYAARAQAAITRALSEHIRSHSGTGRVAVLGRLAAITAALRAGERLTAEVLARRAGVTTRTTYRDLVALREMGAPIVYDRPAGTYCMTRRWGLGQARTRETPAFVPGRQKRVPLGAARTRSSVAT